MSHVTAYFRTYVISVMCLVVGVLSAAPVSNLPKMIGNLDSQDALVFKGNTSYTKEQICKALYRDKDVIVAISSTADLEKYMQVLETKIRDGYLNDGFPVPHVSVSYVAEPEHIAVEIKEGLRYRKGPLLIEGADDELKEELSRCLNDMDPRVSDASGLSDLMNSLQKGDVNAALSKDIYTALLWSSWKPPSFAPSFSKAAQTHLKKLLEVLGYYHCEFELELVRDDEQRTGSLHITFQNQGVRPQIGTINVIGNTIHSDEQILNFLGVKKGQRLDDILVQNFQQKLHKSGRFRFVEVKPEIDTDNPAQSVLNITVIEPSVVTPLGAKLTDEEALMQKVGQFMDRYQTWDKDVWFQVDFNKFSEFVEQLDNYGILKLKIEGVYSSTKGIIFSIIHETQTLHTFVLSPEQFMYYCPPLKECVLTENLKSDIMVTLKSAPDLQSGKKDGWGVMVGMGVASGPNQTTSSYQPIIEFHPSLWFYVAHNPDNEITMLDDQRAVLKQKGVEIVIDRGRGEIVEILSGTQAGHLKFIKGAFDEWLQDLQDSTVEQNFSITKTSFGMGIWQAALSVCLTHAPEGRFTLEQKLQFLNAFRQIASVFDSLPSPAADDKLKNKSFPIPYHEQLASGGIMPMLLGAVYQSCQENLPRDSWIRTLSHASVLVSSGYGQTASLKQDLKQLYNSEQIGPVGYYLTARFLRQLGYSAYGSFAERGLQVMSADDFRKDWQPLLTKDSEIKAKICNVLENIQALNDEDAQTFASMFNPAIKALFLSTLDRVKEADIEHIAESIDPVLAEFWEKFFKEQMRQELNKLIVPVI